MTPADRNYPHRRPQLYGRRQGPALSARQAGLIEALLPRLRAQLPKTRFVVLTLWDTDAYRQAALAAGADEFVPKSQMTSHLGPALLRLKAHPV